VGELLWWLDAHALELLPGGWHKKARLAAGEKVKVCCVRSRTEASWFNQANLIAPCGEFTTLITLYNHATTRFDADHPGTNPAKSGGFENLDDIAGL
jgi:hypothetical protein